MATENTPAGQATTPAADGTKPAAEGTTQAPTAGDTTGKDPKAGEGTPAATDANATPIVPDKYTLTLPEGSPFDESDLVGFADEAKALGLTQDAAQKLVDTRIEQVNVAASKYLSELTADPEMGGANLEKTVELAKAGRDVLFPPDSEEAALINDWFERTGLGNHKLLVRAFARLGRRMAEDPGVTGGGKGGDIDDGLTPAQRRYGKDGKGRPAEIVKG